MTKSLIIVESPTKAKAIKKYMGSAFTVKASVGHVKDLPVSKLGVDVEKNFEPTYQIIKGKKKIVDEIVAAAALASNVYLATDPDREGEAIAWHLAEEIRGHKPEVKKGKKGAGKKQKAKKAAGPRVQRVLFHEITPKSVKEAIAKPVELDKNLFDAQQARRILDRLVGYKISPILWDKVQRGLSAGRVQSVAVRIICEREAEIKAFVAQEYWSVVASLEGGTPPPFEAKLIEAAGKKVEIKNKGEADKIVTELGKSTFTLSKITRQERRRHPVPPFTTSKLQQEAARKLGFTTKRTMMLAQQLYEGIELGDGGIVGLITYMRTDSVRVSESAIAEARAHIAEKYGAETLPEGPNYYRNKRGAQDAHEAVRPTSLEYTPEYVKGFLDKDQARLYELIWKRFLASQMNSAVYDQTIFNIAAGSYLLRATGQVMKFAGFMSVYLEGVDVEGERDEEENPTLPELTEGEKLKLHELKPNQHFTQPPPRFTEASLVKELEEQGIGRPSTYSSIMSTIQEKNYAKKEQGKFFPTQLGGIVNDLLVQNFPEILDVKFTAQMEEELDDVEEGKRKWTSALEDFYGPFAKTLARAGRQMKNLKKQAIETDVICEKCGQKMVIKWGRHGEFLACSKYPDCKSTREFVRDDDGNIKLKEKETTTEICEKCGAPMLIKRGRFGKFLACSGYPECKTTKSIGVGVKCPDCGGEVVTRRGKGGRSFYGCGNYPNCKFVSWDKPVPEACPKCGNPYLVEKYSKKDGASVGCPKKECGFKK